MTKENTVGDLLKRLDIEMMNPKDSVHQIVLKINVRLHVGRIFTVDTKI